MVKQFVRQQVDGGSNPTPSLQESHDDCKYLGNDLWVRDGVNKCPTN